MPKAKVVITYKRAVLDPQGRAVEGSLHRLGFPEARNVRVGRFVELDLDGPGGDAGRARVEEMCRKLLANPVIEDFRVEIEG